MYTHKEIEKKWKSYWEKNKTYKIENDFSKPKFYTLDMFPYPSGAGLHVGHPEGMTANDILARYKTANGFNVLHPMGWDAFGLPAENYAIKTGTHPRITTDQNINTFRAQIKALGFSYDWDREIDTTDPKYYKWTQWIFLKLFEKGLAYEQDLPINYCPSCQTGLANEEVLNDFTCERCGAKVEKKQIRQWVLGITKYADRLLNDVDKLDWPEGIKDMQRNWIGKSEGCEFSLKKSDDNTKSISVYTTRVDTVFGMTYAVLAPDHKDVNEYITEENKEECLEYILNASKKSDQDRTQDDKEKTGVFTGSYVVNPFNGKEVPLWIGDYVLGNYGTGAVMAVPAHDIRDYEFAIKYNLEIIQSVAKLLKQGGKDKAREDKETIRRKTVNGILVDNKNNKIYVLDWEKFGWKSFVIGGVDEKETDEEAIIREIKEETGYQNIKVIKKLGQEVHSNFFAAHKDVNRYAETNSYLVELIDETHITPSENETANHKGKWIDSDSVSDYINLESHKITWNSYIKGNSAYTEHGILINSGEFSGLTTAEALVKMAQFSEQDNFGTKKINYKLRDWLFSRQRYWGEPIPLIHLEKSDLMELEQINDLSEASDNTKAYILFQTPENDFDSRTVCSTLKKEKFLVIKGKVFSKIYEGLYSRIVCDYSLPLELPEVENYEPAGDGQSPLAQVDDFVNVQLAENLSGKRETNTMPQWGGSCWYYLRYMDNENSEELVSPEAEKYWGQVDSYVGGAEHAVLHLLYARFWHKFLFDIGVVSSDEPFYRLRNQGLILAHAFQRKNGGLLANDLVEVKAGKYFEIETGEEVDRIVSKMSKSLKNVINPDDIVEEYGADSLRLYEMYMAEFKDTAPWDIKGIVGVRRFLEKSERLFGAEAKLSTIEDNETMKLLHKTIKKVSEDIENYKFNTGIAAMMILVNNGLPKNPELQTEWKNTFIRILHPFAPFLAEELWERIGETESVFKSTWPKYDEKMIVDDTIKIAVQVLGKVRGTIEINKDEDKNSVLEKAKNNTDVAKWLEGKTLVKEIYVPGKIVNLVVK